MAAMSPNSHDMVQTCHKCGSDISTSQTECILADVKPLCSNCSDCGKVPPPFASHFDETSSDERCGTIQEKKEAKNSPIPNPPIQVEDSDKIYPHQHTFGRYEDTIRLPVIVSELVRDQMAMHEEMTELRRDNQELRGDNNNLKERLKTLEETVFEEGRRERERFPPESGLVTESEDGSIGNGMPNIIQTPNVSNTSMQLSDSVLQEGHDRAEVLGQGADQADSAFNSTHGESQNQNKHNSSSDSGFSSDQTD
ncbi:uncharacterized protein [Ptychodera flava]|uniref:uncharacterized protein n=1 Tax=Ptychodera flava TaxID=63121 RepID=UPI003969DA59